MSCSLLLAPAIVIACLLSLRLVFAGALPSVASRCLWNGSGVPGDESIRVVRLSCDRGAVVWRQPIGAIHVRIDVGDNELRQVCLKLLPDHSKFVSMRLVEKNKLTPLELRQGEVRCIEKNKSDNTVSIFLQSTNSEPWRTAYVGGFNYELTSKRRSKRAMLDCKICNNDEIMQSYCNANFIFEGHFRGVSTDNSIGKRQVVVDKFIRRPMLYAEILHKDTNGQLTALIDDCFSSESERLFIAQTRLDGVHVLCSPFIEEFKRLAKENEDKAPCQLI